VFFVLLVFLVFDVLPFMFVKGGPQPGFAIGVYHPPR
jgi:hypothetical protein